MQDNKYKSVILPRQEPGASLATSELEPFGLPLHLQTGVWSFMRLNNIWPESSAQAHVAATCACACTRCGGEITVDYGNQK